VDALVSCPWGGAKDCRWLEIAVRNYTVAHGFLLKTATEERSAMRLGNAYNELGKAQLALGDLSMAQQSFQKGVEAFEAADDAQNYALLCCNVAHVLRRQSHMLSAEECGGGTGLLHEQRAKYALAISWFEQAMKKKGLRIRAGEIYEAVRLELARAYGALSHLIVDAVKSGSVPEAVIEEDPALVQDLLNKALSICEQSGASKPPPVRILQAEVLTSLGEYLTVNLIAKTPQASAAKLKLIRRHVDSALRHFEMALQLVCAISPLSSAQWRVDGSLDALRQRVVDGALALCEAASPHGWQGELLESVRKTFLNAHKQLLVHREQYKEHSDYLDEGSVMLQPVQQVLKQLLKHCEPRRLASLKEMYRKTLKASPEEAADILSAVDEKAR